MNKYMNKLCLFLAVFLLGTAVSAQEEIIEVSDRDVMSDSVQMQVDGPFAYGTAAGIRQFGPVHTPQKAPQKYQRGAHLASPGPIDPVVIYKSGIYNQHMPFPLYPAPRHRQHLQHMIHI